MFSLQDIVLNYGSLSILDGFNLQCGQQELLCLFGPSGVGKTSILNLLAHLVKPQSGRIQCHNHCLAYVFQEPRLVPWLTVEQNIQIGMHAAGAGAGQRRHQVQRLLPLLGLEGFGLYYPGQLSGGMKQRVSIGRAFAIEPDLLLLDEPFSSLDANLKQDMQELLVSLRQWHPCSTVMVTHDAKEAITLSDRVVVLQGQPCQVVLDVCPAERQRLDNEHYEELKAALLKAIERPEPILLH